MYNDRTYRLNLTVQSSRDMYETVADDLQFSVLGERQQAFGL